MDTFDAEILDLWRLLHKNGVRYIMVGGFAVNFHKYWRVTNDLDLYLEDTSENRKKLRQVFIDLGLGDYEPIERIEFIPGWTDFRLNSGFRLDIMTSLKGLEAISFNECFDMANVTSIYDIPVRFLHYNHLIESKKAANRPKDQLDIIELEKIRKISEEKGE